MASSIIGALRVVLGLDTAQFESGAGKAKETMSGLRGALGGFGASFAAVAGPAALATTAMAAFAFGMKKAGEAAQFADDLAASAYKLGVSAEYLQGFNHAAEASDVPIEAAQKALLGFSAAIGALQTGIGDGKIRKALEGLGIPQAQIDSFKSVEDALPVVADKISQLGTVTEQLQIAKKFGLEDLLPLLKQGSAGIQGLMDKARDLGLVLGEDVVNRLADMNEEMRVAEERAKFAGLSFGANFTPALVAMKNAASDGVLWLGKLIDRFNKLSDRSDETLSKQISEAKSQLEFMKKWHLVDKYDVEDMQAGIMNLEEARRQNNRTAMRKKAAAGRSESEDSSGGVDIKPPAKSLTESEKAAARAKAEGRVAGPSDADLWASGKWVNGLKTATVSVDDVLDIKPGDFDKWTKDITLATGDGTLAGIVKGIQESRQAVTDQIYYGIRGGLQAAREGGFKGLAEFFADSLARRLDDRLADIGSKWLENLLFTKGGGGGVLSSIAGAFGFGGVGANASGTSNWRGGLTWVGEHGEELVNLPRGSQVTPNRDIQRGGSLVQNFYLTGNLVTEKVYGDMQAMADRAAVQGATGGAQLAQESLGRRSSTRLR